MSSAATELRLQVPTHQRWIARLSDTQRVFKQLCSRSFIFSSGGVLDWLVSHQYPPQISLMLAGAIVSAAVALFFLKTVSEAHERHKSVVRWLQRVAEMNHHIRNAFQIITFNNVAERSTEAIKRVDSAVTRIESGLREASPSARVQAASP